MCRVCVSWETLSLHPSWTHSLLFSAQASGLAHTSDNAGRLQTTLDLSSATRLGRPVSSLTGNGLRGDGSFLQAPLTPGTQGLLPLHLRGCVLCRHQGLCSWGQRITSFGAVYVNDRQLDVLGVRSTADSSGQGRAQGSWVSMGNYGEPRGAGGPGSREAISIQDKGVGQATK